MSDEIHQGNLVETVRDTFPEMEESIRETKLLYGGEKPGNYLVFGTVLRPYFEEELAQRQITDFLLRLATFMERVCESGDAEAINVVWIEIFEYLIHQPKPLKLLWPILGPLTRNEIEDAAWRWGRVLSLPISAMPSAVMIALRHFYENNFGIELRGITR